MGALGVFISMHHKLHPCLLVNAQRFLGCIFHTWVFLFKNHKNNKLWEGGRQESKGQERERSDNSVEQSSS